MKNKKLRPTKNNFKAPEAFLLTCPTCGETLDTCDICKEPFELDDRYKVACCKDMWHICWYCWLDLPEGE